MAAKERGAFITTWVFICEIPQHTARYYDTMHYTATLYAIEREARLIGEETHPDTLHHTATHCNTLQHTATHCNTLQHTATHCNKSQHTTTHCNTPQHTASTAKRMAAKERGAFITTRVFISETSEIPHLRLWSH